MTKGEIGSIDGNANASGELYPASHDLTRKLRQQTELATSALRDVRIETEEQLPPQPPIRRMPGRGSFA